MFSDEDTSDVDYYSDGSFASRFWNPQYVTDVKNQCFSNYSYDGYDSNNCWIFGTLAAMESAILNNTNKTDVDLSEEHVRQSLLKGILGIDNEYKYSSDSYNVAGNFDMVLAYMQRDQHYGPAYENSTQLGFGKFNSDVLSSVDVDMCEYYPTEINAIGNITYPDTPNYSTVKERVNKIKSLIQNNKNVVVSYYTKKQTIKRVLIIKIMDIHIHNIIIITFIMRNMLKLFQVLI